jgi:hypothetical protein
MASFFGFGPAAKIDMIFDNCDGRATKTVDIAEGAEPVPLYIFSGEEDISGTVVVSVPPGKTFEHLGIKIELIGQIELYYDRGSHYEFTSLHRELSAPKEMSETEKFAFEFSSSSVEKQYESYSGMNVHLRYIVRVTATRQYAANLVEETEFLVQNVQPPPEINNSIKMEVGIEDCSHIEFEYNKSKYHLKDVVIGKIYFLLVRIKIKHMEVAIIRRESAGTGPNLYNDSETLTKFEIMDGAPVRGECIPIRLFLNEFALTPTYRNICNKFSVKYYLNLVLVDEEDRRYFKQQEILLWRERKG